MQTGQNSIAPENRLPQLGQVRRGFVFMDLSVLRVANIEHPVTILNGTKDSEPGQGPCYQRLVVAAREHVHSPREIVERLAG